MKRSLLLAAAALVAFFAMMNSSDAASFQDDAGGASSMTKCEPMTLVPSYETHACLSFLLIRSMVDSGDSGDEGDGNCLPFVGSPCKFKIDVFASVKLSCRDRLGIDGPIRKTKTVSLNCRREQTVSFSFTGQTIGSATVICHACILFPGEPEPMEPEDDEPIEPEDDDSGTDG